MLIIRNRNNIIKLLAVIIGGGGFIIIFLTATAIKVSESPRFCQKCHLMNPYYQTWEQSVHRDIPCVDCHYEPGFIAVMKAKVTRGLPQLVKTITHDYGEKPLIPDVKDVSCLREGCHNKITLQKKILFGSTQFNHQSHFKLKIGNSSLRCSSCHSYTEKGLHIEVNSGVCSLCHFNPGLAGNKAPTECLSCHYLPTKTLNYEGMSFSHLEAVNEAHNCEDCHSGMNIGQGTVTEESCTACHGQQKPTTENSDSLHAVHVNTRGIACFRCHDQVLHTQKLPLELECQMCHGE